MVKRLGNGVATLSMNRPDVLNALDDEMLDDMFAALNELDADTDTRAIVLRGEGEKAFAAGGDLKQMRELSPLQFHQYCGRFGRNAVAMVNLGTPIVAAAHGYTFGGGVTLCLASDIVVAAESTRFGFSEINVGLIGPSEFLLDTVGKHRTAELLLLGKRFGAAEAKEMGIVNAVVPDGAQDVEALQIAEQLAAKSPNAIRLAKQVMRRALGDRVLQTLDAQQAMASLLFGTHDQYEAMSALLERRDPILTGSTALRLAQSEQPA